MFYSADKYLKGLLVSNLLPTSSCLETQNPWRGRKEGAVCFLAPCTKVEKDAFSKSEGPKSSCTKCRMTQTLPWASPLFHADCKHCLHSSFFWEKTWVQSPYNSGRAQAKEVGPGDVCDDV